MTEQKHRMALDYIRTLRNRGNTTQTRVDVTFLSDDTVLKTKAV